MTMNKKYQLVLIKVTRKMMNNPNKKLKINNNCSSNNNNRKMKQTKKMNKKKKKIHSNSQKKTIVRIINLIMFKNHRNSQNMKNIIINKTIKDQRIIN